MITEIEKIFAEFCVMEHAAVFISEDFFTQILLNFKWQMYLSSYTKFQITFVEQRACTLLSLPTEQLLERYWWEIVHPADERTVHKIFTQVLEVFLKLLLV